MAPKDKGKIIKSKKGKEKDLSGLTRKELEWARWRSVLPVFPPG
jgi:hypothetical protein